MINRMNISVFLTAAFLLILCPTESNGSFNLTTSLQSGYGGSCTTTFKYDPSMHKPTYRVGVLAYRGIENAFAGFNNTFNTYLTATAGKRFDPPISFEMVAITLDNVIKDALDVDFLFLAPSFYSCLESEFGANSLASIISRRNINGNIHHLQMFGGVIFARHDNDKVNTIRDLKDKVIATASITGFGSGQMQFREMQAAGLSHTAAPKQLIFTGNQGKIVNGVLSGSFEVGFVRTDQIERTKDSEGNLVNASMFKVIDPKPGLAINGQPFPFEASTQLYPEWNLAAHSHTPDDVAEAVQTAILAIDNHAQVAESIIECEESYNATFCDMLPYPKSFGTNVRCDTSKEVASIALQAMQDGNYAGWRTTLSYMEIRAMQEATGFIEYVEEEDTWRCLRGSELYDGITCPAGHHKKSPEEVANGCEKLGLSCEGFTCICSPCEEPLVCEGASTKIGSKCVSYALLYTLILIPVAVLAAIAVYVYIKEKERKADSVWTVHPDELIFGEPAEVIGQGTFGVVLLAEYRGTKVAVKRVIPRSKNKKIGDKRTKDFDYSDHQSRAVAAEDDGTRSVDIEVGGCDTSGTRGSGSSVVSMDKHMVARIKPSGIATIRPISKDDFSKFKSHFISEMRHLSKLRHPCITTVMGAVISKSHEPMLVMEYMSYGSLYDILHNETMVIEGEILLPILLDIARGIRFLHSAHPQVLHGDLKSQNILVDSKFRAKVADFGLSQKKLVGAAGTLYWMAPELLRGDSTNSAASDIYSIGIILYEVYSRKEPYEGEDVSDVLPKICDPKVNYRPPVPSNCPQRVAAIMKDCLLEQPNDRPTAQELDVRLNSLSVSNVEPVVRRRSSSSNRETKMNSKLLYNVFPKSVADALAAGKKVEPEHHSNVSIVFSDIVGFTDISSASTPIQISDMLDRLYNKLDDLATKHGVFKVETIGDAYMGVTNLSNDQETDHVKRVAEFALEAIEVASKTLIDLDDPSRGYIQLRVGFHSGSVVSNVIGSLSPKYSIFGDAVNTAARMESTSMAGKVHCSARSAELLELQSSTLRIVPRGSIMVKGKGVMSTFWVQQDDWSKIDD